MFKVEVGGRKFRVYFRYGVANSRHGTALLVDFGSRTTTCVIDEDDVGIWRGTATCSDKDKFVKSAGRKIALTRALNKFSRSQRTAFWAVYHASVRGNARKCDITDNGLCCQVGS